MFDVEYYIGVYKVSIIYGYFCYVVLDGFF